MEKNQTGLAVITGADGGMGTEITRAVAKAGYRVVMVCYDVNKGKVKRDAIRKDTGNQAVELMQVDLSSLHSVAALADVFLQRGEPIALLMNNAGTMETHRQVTALANLGLLRRFVGMLTDSRSFLSYTRHEYFRRIMCNLVGTWVEEGEIPYDREILEPMIKEICFNNAKNYFNLDI